jgi:hypothetical protein
MPLTNFQYGVSSFGMPVIGSGPIFTTGNVFFVSSTTPGASTGNDGLSPQTPLSTIVAALAKCVANNGDTIIVEPGHVETVTSAAQILMSTSGVSIIGIGRGANRPTVNFTTSVNASLRVTAANCYIENVLFIGVVDALVSPIDIRAADFTLRNCETRDTPSTAQATDFILTTAAATRLSILNHRHDGDTAAGANSFLAIVGGDRIVVDGLIADGNFNNALIEIRTTAATDLEVRNCMFRTRIGTQAKDIFLKDTITGSTGLIGPSLYMFLSTNTANITEAITGATFVLFDDILVVNLAGEKAMLINTIASTDA